MAEYTSDQWKHVLGTPVIRRWYTLNFEDGHVELFTLLTGRVRRVAELTSQALLDTVVSYDTIDIPAQSLHNLATPESKLV